MAGVELEKSAIDREMSNQQSEKQSLGSTPQSWKPSGKPEKTSMQSVMLVQLGVSQAPRNPIVAKPSGAKVTERQDTETVRLTVHGKYAGECLSSHFADSFLKQIWPAEFKAARNFGSWRTEKSKTNEMVALTSYVTASKAVVEALLQKSGTTRLFVARLAKDKINDEKLHPFWVPRVDGTSDYEYLQMARKALTESKCPTTTLQLHCLSLHNLLYNHSWEQ